MEVGPLCDRNVAPPCFYTNLTGPSRFHRCLLFILISSLLIRLHTLRVLIELMWWVKCLCFSLQLCSEWCIMMKDSWVNSWSLCGQVCTDRQVNRFTLVSGIISGKLDSWLLYLSKQRSIFLPLLNSIAAFMVAPMWEGQATAAQSAPLFFLIYCHLTKIEKCQSHLRAISILGRMLVWPQRHNHCLWDQVSVMVENTTITDQQTASVQLKWWILKEDEHIFDQCLLSAHLHYCFLIISPLINDWLIVFCLIKEVNRKISRSNWEEVMLPPSGAGEELE